MFTLLGISIRLILQIEVEAVSDRDAVPTPLVDRGKKLEEGANQRRG